MYLYMILLSSRRGLEVRRDANHHPTSFQFCQKSIRDPKYSSLSAFWSFLNSMRALRVNDRFLCTCWLYGMCCSKDLWLSGFPVFCRKMCAPGASDRFLWVCQNVCDSMAFWLSGFRVFCPKMRAPGASDRFLWVYLYNWSYRACRAYVSLCIVHTARNNGTGRIFCGILYWENYLISSIVF